MFNDPQNLSKEEREKFLFERTKLAQQVDKENLLKYWQEICMQT